MKTKQNKGKSKTFMQRAFLAMDEAIEETAKDEEISAEPAAQDEGESIDQIVEKILPGESDENKALLKAFLLKLKGAVEATPEAMDEDAAAKDEDVAGSEDTAKDEDPVTSEATQDEETAEDEEPEKEEGKTAMDKKTVMAMDAKTVQTIKASARQETIAAMRNLASAAKRCSPLVGSNLDAFAFDSAADIYAKALQVNGVNPKLYPKSAYRGMVDMMLKNAPALKHSDAAFDALPQAMSTDKAVDAIFKNLDKIDVQ